MRHNKLPLRQRLKMAEAFAKDQGTKNARANYLIVAILRMLDGGAVLSADLLVQLDADIKAWQGKIGWQMEPLEGGGARVVLTEVGDGQAE